MKKQKITRRILAAFCVICIALLQCFVLMPAASDGVHAAAGSVDFVAHYKNDVPGTRSNKSWITSADSKEIEIPDDEGNPIQKTGYRLSSILKNAKLNDNESVKINGNTVSDPSEAYLIDIDGSWELYKDGALTGDVVDVIDVKLDKYPIEITEVKADKTKPYKGDKVTISYKLKVESFYKNSNEYEDYGDDILTLDWVASNGKVSPESTTTNKTSGSFTVTVNESGEVTISPKAGDSDFSYLDGSSSVTLSGKNTKLTVKPSSVSLTVGESKTCTVKYNGETVSSGCTWSSSKSSVATVSSGLIRGVKAGKATVTVKYNGKSATVSVTVKERKTSSYTRSTYRPTYHTYRPTRSSNTIRTSGTGATRPTTATRPTETVSTAAPSFQTMKVKEVYLTPVEQDPYGGDEFGDEFTDEGNDENLNEDESFDEDGVTFPAAAGSAAVAVAACGAGAVGRVRKFHIDMGDISSAKDIAAGGDGGMGGDGQSAETTGDAGDGEGKSSEKRSRNPLKKFRK